jgi:2Fe-2S ferredoxin
VEIVTIPIKIEPDEITIEGLAGDTILDSALAGGVMLAHDCGGNCACTTCHVIIDSGGENLSAMEPVEDDRLATAPNRTSRSRLACQALLTGGPITITPQEAW